MKRTALPTLLLLLAAALSPSALLAASDSVFQYTVPVTTEKNPSAAFLWIPPDAKQVRGVVMAGMTLMEREFVKDPVIRKACADEQLAIVFLKCGLGATDLPKVLGDLAKISGYRELPMAPLFFVGHSAGGPQAKARAIEMSSRCFGLMQYRGGAPGGAETVPPGVPAVMMMGQFDEFGGVMRDEAGTEAWERVAGELAAFRAQHERNLGSLVVEPGAGHFAWSQRNAAYLAMFIRKAAQARIPEWAIDAKEPVQCKEVDHQRGWLTALAMKKPDAFQAAAYAEFKGEKSGAAWHFDQEMAEATAAYHAGFGRKDQFIKWTDPVMVDAGARYFFTNLKWVGDGQTFEVHPEYAEAFPKPQPSGGPRWGKAGQPVGRSKAPILVRPVSGPVIANGANTFRMQFDGLSSAAEGGRVTFLAYSEGDAEYRHTEQVGMMPRGFAGLKNGKDQTITFAPLSPLKANSPPVEIKATSSAGLPVEFYVAHGPATIADGKLRIVELPARATFPIEIKVVAWQFGRGIEPLVKTATAVEQTILIEAP